MNAPAGNEVCVGRVTGVYGIKGWIRVHSYTEPAENILQFTAWTLVVPSADDSGETRAFRVTDGRQQGRHTVARLSGVDTRDAAECLRGAEIFVRRVDLPACEDGVYYWVDLIGLEVRNLRGDLLGRISHLLETGAHDVLVLDGGDEQMIPFALDRIVRSVDLDRRVVTVDWETSYWEQ